MRSNVSATMFSGLARPFGQGHCSRQAVKPALNRFGVYKKEPCRILLVDCRDAKEKVQLESRSKEKDENMV